MLNHKIIATFAIIAAITSPIAYAEKVEFSLGDTEGTFHCVVNTYNPFATVDIHTDAVEVNGFCGKQKYVKRPGHVTSMPVSVLKNHFFQYKKSIERNGSISVIPSKEGAVTCSEGQGDKKKPYGDGKYC